MKLTLNTLQAITSGAVRIEEHDGFHFHRFTSAQEAQYATLHPDLLRKTTSTPGVCLEFISDTRHLTIDADFAPSTTRKYYAFDILCDNQLITSITNYTAGDPLFTTDFSLANKRDTVTLPNGVKTVKVVFPWSVTPTIREISIDDGASIQPAPKKDILLCYGDSITHGYDALRPSESYVCRLADKLNLAICNKAIGGEVFFPELLDTPEEFTPKYITVAYGTNDWFKCSFKTFERNCRAFYTTLAERYPNVPIFAITPIWRRDKNDPTPFGDFTRVRDTIFAVAAQFDNILPIDGIDFVPHDGDTYFADRQLHPNSAGFAHYADKLYNAMRPHL